MRWHNSKEELPPLGEEVVVYYCSRNKYQVSILPISYIHGEYLINGLWAGKVEEFPYYFPYWIELPLPEMEENE